MACSVSQVQTDGQLGLFENLVSVCRHSANLLHSRSPFSCASSASIIGSVSHPVESGLLPSDNRIPESEAILYMYGYVTTRTNELGLSARSLLGAQRCGVRQCLSRACSIPIKN